MVISFPLARIPREQQQEAFLRKLEIDPVKYMPKDLLRPLVTTLPPITSNIPQRVAQKAGAKIETTAEESLERLREQAAAIQEKIKNKLKAE